MVAIRDLKCSMDIAEMAALGWFPYEFIVYGYSYVEEGILYYKVSSQDTALYHYKEQHLKQNIYATPIIELLNRISIPSGMQNEYMLQTKIKLAKQLQQNYPANLMQQFTALAVCENNNYASNLLMKLQHNLIGCFDQTILQLAESIFLYAFQEKKLTVEAYTDFVKWFQYIYSQMEDDMVPSKIIKRTFYGFAYQTETKKMNYFTNASESEIKKKKESLYCKGISSTPILQKTYYFDYQPNLSTVKEDFLQSLKHWIDKEYMWYLNSIDQLPSPINRNKLLKLLELAKENQNTAFISYVKYYLSLWNL